MLFDKASAKVFVVLENSSSHVVQRQAILGEPCRVNFHLILLYLASPGIYLADSRNRSELPLDLPLLNILEGYCAHWTRERVLIQFAKRCGWQPKNRLHTRWELCRHLLQTLVDKLTGKI